MWWGADSPWSQTCLSFRIPHLARLVPRPRTYFGFISFVSLQEEQVCLYFKNHEAWSQCCLSFEFLGNFSHLSTSFSWWWHSPSPSTSFCQGTSRAKWTCFPVPYGPNLPQSSSAKPSLIYTHGHFLFPFLKIEEALSYLKVMTLTFPPPFPQPTTFLTHVLKFSFNIDYFASYLTLFGFFSSQWSRATTIKDKQKVLGILFLSSYCFLGYRLFQAELWFVSWFPPLPFILWNLLQRLLIIFFLLNPTVFFNPYLLLDCVMWHGCLPLETLFLWLVQLTRILASHLRAWLFLCSCPIRHPWNVPICAFFFSRSF